MKRKSFFIGVTLALFLSTGMFAQDNKKLNQDPNTRSLAGVVELGGSPVAGANVQLKDLKTLQIRSYVTHEDGAYHFAGLSTSVDYEVRAQHEGHSSDTKNLSTYDSRKTAIINLKLK